MFFVKIEMRIWRTVNKLHLVTVLKFVSYTSKLMKIYKYKSKTDNIGLGLGWWDERV